MLTLCFAMMLMLSGCVDPFGSTDGDLAWRIFSWFMLICGGLYVIFWIGEKIHIVERLKGHKNDNATKVPPLKICPEQNRDGSCSWGEKWNGRKVVCNPQRYRDCFVYKQARKLKEAYWSGEDDLENRV